MRQGGEHEHSILLGVVPWKDLDSSTAVLVLKPGSMNLSSSLNLCEPQFPPW